MAKHDASASINEVSRISAGTEVQGNLISKSDIRIDGLFEGDMVTSGKLVLGDSSKGQCHLLKCRYLGKC